MGQDFTFGEGTEEDAHDAAEAEAHTVLHITKPGTYSVSGTMSAGQIAIDLGDEAEDDPNAVVTLILDNVDISCSVAPAVIFYHVYECGDPDSPSETVDTTSAGANVWIADGSENHVNGSYVAKIYKPGTLELNEDGTEVLDAKKLHKYDAAFYSKMSMNIDGNDGILDIHAENEGLDSELHLTINGGNIRIFSGNDGINTNEDGVSVTTINGGDLQITVTGETGEGDGIDSNGWLVINGGSVTASACGFSGDAGIDSDMGIYMNGGTVIATGHMLDRIAGGNQTYAVFAFSQTQTGGETYTLRNTTNEDIFVVSPHNDFSCMILAGDSIAPDDYTFFLNETQLSASVGQGSMRGPGGMKPGIPQDMQPESDVSFPEGKKPGSFQPPEGMTPEDWEPQDGSRPDTMEPPEGMQPPHEEWPEGTTPPDGKLQPQNGKEPFSPEQMGDISTIFSIVAGGNYFSNVSAN